MDFDNEGNFNGFTIRTDVCKALMFRDKGKLDNITKIIKTTNYMNRLLLEGNKDYVLGQKKVSTDTKEFACQVDTFEPVIIEKMVKDPDAAPKPKPAGSEMICSPEMKEFMSRLKAHVVDIIVREKPNHKAYYSMVWEDQTLDELCQYKLANVYEDVPEEGFKSEYDRPDDINVCEYFKILFKTIEEKLLTCVPREDKKDLNIS